MANAAQNFAQNYGLDPTAAALAITGLPAFSGLLFGCVLSNNSTTAVDVTAGTCADSTGASLMAFTALTNKILGTAWAVGSSAGMLDTGAVSNTTYHIFVIKKDANGVCDILASLSPTAPTMPAGYTYFRRIGSILREGGSVVLFTQNGDEFLRLVPVQDVNNAQNPGTSAVTVTNTVPLGIIVNAIISFSILDSTPAASTQGLLRALSQTDTAPSTSLWDIFVNSYGAVIPASATITRNMRTNTSGQWAYRLSASTTDHFISVLNNGWIDTRGRLA